MTIHLYESTDFETLWSGFTQRLHEPMDHPLAIETIVVPSTGWNSYFSRRLAKTLGQQRRPCWAQYRFLTLGSWAHQTLDEQLGSDETPRRDVGTIRWAVANALPGLLEQPAFSTVKNYLEGHGEEVVARRLEFAKEVARLFDQYLLYRPNLIAAWEAGEDWPQGIGETVIPIHAQWQSELWRTIREALDVRPVAEAVQKLTEVEVSSARVPERLSVWLGGSIAPAYLNLLTHVGSARDLAVYRTSVSDTYWGDMHGRRDYLRKLMDSDLTLSAFCEAEQLDVLHPLLASWGGGARDTHLQLLDRDMQPWVREDLPVVPNASEEGSVLLTRVQTDLRDAIEPEADVSAIAPDDLSLSVHACHGPLREVEVIRDQLRDALERDPALMLEDIVVMCPDLETYAPLIESVFGATRNQSRHIPFHIAGRSPRRTRPIVESYLRLLQVLAGRFERESVLDLVAIDAVASKVDLKPRDIEDLARWLDDAGVRWGLDAEHRICEGVNRTDLNTWSFGVDRLLMGYMMPPACQCLVGGDDGVSGILPLDRAEGLGGARLGAIWQLVDRFKAWQSKLTNPRVLEEWRGILCCLLDSMIDTSQDDAGAAMIYNALDRLVQGSTAVGYDEKLAFDHVRRLVSAELDQAAAGAPFRLGGVTVCDMAAMRGLPFKVIAVLGLSDGVFPRADRPVSFDLMTEGPQELGDRSLRREDKHQLLEALLSAKERLMVTYLGQSLHDQRTRPASVLIEELLDTLDSLYADEAGAMRERLLVKHPLQPFSPRYFKDPTPRIFSYDDHAFAIARALTQTRETDVQLASGVLADEPSSEIRLTSLIDLVRSPWQVYLRRLGVFINDRSYESAMREPLVLDQLQQWHIGDRWLADRLAGHEPKPLEKRLQRSGSLPAGAAASNALEPIVDEAELILKKARAMLGDAPTTVLPIELELRGCTIVGRISGWTGSGIVQALYSRVKLDKVLMLWVRHLLVCAIGAAANPTAELIGREDKNGLGSGVVSLKSVPVDQARSILADYLDLMSWARRFPLPFFQECVAKAVKTVGKLEIEDLDDPATRAAIVQAYLDSFLSTPPCEQPSVRAAFAGHDPMTLRCRDLPGFSDDSPDRLLFDAVLERLVSPINPYLQLGGDA